jgi:NAD(P)-dependent dehydrogenase (short-subunit alcohol dehydrogenase family)
MRLKNKIAIITGAAEGIGYAIARKYSNEGAIVFICDIDDDKGYSSAEKIKSNGNQAFFIHLDVSSEIDWTEALRKVCDVCNGVDILVNNAGINIRVAIEDMEEKDFDKMYAINVKGPFFGIKHTIPLFRRRKGGSIINISSVCGLIGHKYTTEAYTITKGALTLMTKSIAVRYASDNIRCNSIHPSTVDTPLLKSILSNPEKRSERLNEIPLGRLATVEDVANAAVFLASDEASFINGISLPVDGGLTAY